MFAPLFDCDSTLGTTADKCLPDDALAVSILPKNHYMHYSSSIGSKASFGWVEEGDGGKVL